MFVLYDLFLITRHLIRDIPIIPGANHHMFPRLPIYNTSFIGQSPITHIELEAHQIETRSYQNYIILTACPLHDAQLYSEQKYTAEVYRSSPRQFGLIQAIDPNSEDSVLIRQGNCLILFREVWRLVLVIFEHDRVQLFYQPQINRVPMLLRIVEEVAGSGFTGKYELVDRTSRR